LTEFGSDMEAQKPSKSLYENFPVQWRNTSNPIFWDRMKTLRVPGLFQIWQSWLHTVVIVYYTW